jgi:predicted transcriptional regulator
MKPHEIKRRRLELGLTVAELAETLQVTQRELLLIESGDSRLYESAAFEEAFEVLEESVARTYHGA